MLRYVALCATCRVTMRAIKHSEGSSSYCFNGNTKILYPYHQLASSSYCIFSRAHKKCFCAYGQKTELWGMQSLRTISTCRLISTKTLCPQVVSTACVFFVLVSWRRMIFRSTFLAFFWHLEQTLSFEEFFDFSKNVLCLRKSLRLKERRRFSTKIYRRTRSKVLWRKKLIKIHDQVYLEK